MTQLDLPQISLSRYVDLLKRRRWQVIPVSLLGLLIGGVVAFFIPRYFVADTSIAYQRPPGEELTDPEDPFRAIVDSAKLTIPRAIPETIRALGWPEALAEDPFEFSQNVSEIEDRLTIFEFGKSKGQPFALIRVSYKDRDGLRAAAFLNKLAATWISQRQGELMAAAKAKLAAATAEHKQHSNAYNTFLQERQHLQRTYRIEPGIDLMTQRDKHGDLVDGHAEAVAKVAAKKAEVAKLEARLEHERTVLRDLPARVPVDVQALQIEAAKSPEGIALIAQIAYATLARDNYREGTPARAKAERDIQYLTAKLTELAKTPEVDEDGMIPNPAREAQLALIAGLELEARTAAAEIPVLQAQVDKEGERLARQAEGFAQYEAVVKRLGEAQAAAAEAAKKVSAADEIVGKLTNQPSIRQEDKASVPPAPTDPNLLLVALLGCVIGLFAATALVLLLDLAQGSFKTVEDVERTLSVPVLGGVSYLETDAERQHSVRSRRRATLVAAAFLTLVGGVVLLYYFDPTRLPPLVRDMLSMVLGTA